MTASFYGSALARIHQKQYERLSLRRSRALLALLRRHGVHDGTVVDLACGPGGWARELSLRGYSVVGVDISSAMLKLARRRAPHARFLQGSMATVQLPPCDAVTALGEPFNYLLRPADVRRVFRRVFHVLRPSGLFVFDTLEPPRRRPPFVRSHSQGIGKLRLSAKILERPAHRSVVREIDVFRSNGCRVAHEIHRQRTYPAGELSAWLRRAGFRVRILRDPRFLLWERHAALVARRP